MFRVAPFRVSTSAFLQWEGHLSFKWYFAVTSLQSLRQKTFFCLWLDYRGIVLLRSTEKPKHENQIEKDCSECTHCTTSSCLHSNWSGLFLSLSSLAWHDITAAIARLSQIQPFLSAVTLPEVGSTRLTVNLKVIRKNWRNQHLHNHGQSSHYGCALKIPPASNMGSLF